jgi:hypothetical protein
MIIVQIMVMWMADGNFKANILMDARKFAHNAIATIT